MIIIGGSSLFRQYVKITVVFFIILIGSGFWSISQWREQSQIRIDQALKNTVVMAETLLFSDMEHFNSVVPVVRSKQQQIIDLYEYDNYQAMSYVLQDLSAFFDIDLILFISDNELLVSNYPEIEQLPDIDIESHFNIGRLEESTNLIPQSHKVVHLLPIPKELVAIKEDSENKVDYGYFRSIHLTDNNGDDVGRIVLIRLMNERQDFIDEMSNAVDAELTLTDLSGKNMILSSFFSPWENTKSSDSIVTENEEYFYHSQPILNDKDETVAYFEVAKDKRLYTSQDEQLLMSNLFIFISLLIVASFFAWFMKKRIFDRVNIQVKALQSVTNGELDTRVALAKNIPEEKQDEIMRMGVDFNHMMERLENSYIELDEKSSELEQGNQRMILQAEELKKQADALENANIELERMDAVKSNFLSSVSHELRTPLTSILGFAKLINKDFNKGFSPLATGEKKLERMGKRIDSNLDIIIHEGERLTRLINDVLDLAKIESGQVSWNDSTFLVSEVLEQASQSATGQFTNKAEVDLKLEIIEAPLTITADKDKLVQVIINLLNNAAKFTDQGSVTLSNKWIENDRKIQVIVKDTGMGIPEEDVENVFSKFHQVNTNDTLVDKPKGTGLGLSICKDIIQHYGGKIWVESTLGKGSSFIFELPIADSIAVIPNKEDERKLESDGSTESSPSESSNNEDTMESHSILVVDDDPSVRIFLTQLFNNHGFKTYSAANGKEALQLMETGKPDLITMDRYMPVMNGRKAISVMREDPKLRDIPVIVLTAGDDRVKIGGDISLHKPVDEESLMCHIRELIKKGRGIQNELHEIDCLIVDNLLK